jgi:hypothetical protein
MWSTILEYIGIEGSMLAVSGDFKMQHRHFRVIPGTIQLCASMYHREQWNSSEVSKCQGSGEILISWN